MESETSSPVRTTKRKLEDAIRTLDDAIVSPSLAAAIERPTPSKRPYLSRSVYSTLAKFGISSREQPQPPSKSISHNDDITPGLPSTPTTAPIDISKNAPRLSAILARSASKQVPPSNHTSTSPVHPASEYRPSSTESFLFRLATYRITTYAHKPSQIDAVAAVRCGWINDGKDRLVCGICDVSWVLAGREGMNKDAASALVEKQRISLVEMHKDGCPWKARQCDPSVYRVPLQTPSATVRKLRVTARSLEPLLDRISIKHPLNSVQLSSLRSIFSAAASERCAAVTDSTIIGETIVPPDSAIVVSLFGWTQAPAVTRSEVRWTPSLSISHPGSFDLSASVPPTRSLSRVSSVSSRFREPVNTPSPSASPLRRISQLSASPERVGISSHTKHPRFNDLESTVPRDDTLVYCILCQRRVGLWGYTRNNESSPSILREDSTSVSRRHQKEFDVVKEHRSYCPYIISSTVVPSFSHSPTVDSLGSTVEGWRAVLTVVQRYELTQRQRLARFMPSDDHDSQPPSMELKGVEAMVAGVKTNGGRELIRYVKGLLG